MRLKKTALAKAFFASPLFRSFENILKFAFELKYGVPYFLAESKVEWTKGEYLAAARLGVTKINIDTDGRLVWTRVHREFFRDHPEQFDFRPPGKTFVEEYAKFIARKNEKLRPEYTPLDLPSGNYERKVAGMR